MKRNATGFLRIGNINSDLNNFDNERGEID